MRNLSKSAIRGAACRQEPPFLWLSRDDERSRAQRRALKVDHRLSSEWRGGFLIYRVEARRADGCRGLGAAAQLR